LCSKSQRLFEQFTPRRNVDLVSLYFAILIVYMAECSRQENEGITKSVLLHYVSIVILLIF
jgi:hypothetical protein